MGYILDRNQWRDSFWTGFAVGLLVGLVIGISVLGGYQWRVRRQTQTAPTEGDESAVAA